MCRVDLKKHLQAQTNLMTQLADPMRLSKVYVVSCGSRDNEGLLRETKDKVQSKGWDAGLKCFQAWKKKDLSRIWQMG